MQIDPPATGWQEQHLKRLLFVGRCRSEASENAARTQPKSGRLDWLRHSKLGEADWTGSPGVEMKEQAGRETD